MANIFRPAGWLRRRSETTSDQLTPKEAAQAAQLDALHSEFDQGVRAEIERRAYYKWIEAGSPAGRDREFWLLAEQEILEKIQRRRSAL